MESTRYEALASHIQEQVTKEMYRAGERIPSVRQMSQLFGVSVSTVLTAYRLLEDRGVIEARPQSGYFILPNAQRTLPQPEVSTPGTAPTHVTVAELALKVLKATRATDIIQLGTAIPHTDFLPMTALKRAMGQAARQDSDSVAQYSFPPGDDELRRQISRRALTAGCTLAPDEIITTSGAMEALTLALRAVAQPGDTVLVESPTFYGLLQAIEAQGLKALELPTHPQHGVDLNALQQAITQWPIAACVLVPNFNNPLGSCMPEKDKQRLVTMLAEREIPLIEDDIYAELSFAEQRPKAAKSYDKDGNVLLCGGFSKTVSPGLRVGWIAPGRYYAKVEHLKYITSMASATLPQRAMARFLAHGGYERHLRRIRHAYHNGLNTLAQAVALYFPEGTRITQPQGGFVLWVELPEGKDSLQLFNKALTKRISIAPGPLFSATQQYQNCIRLNGALPWSDEVEQATITLARLLK